ncbi:YfhO family protein [Panacibacter ginsenosidivorans]|uniref:YfhO family protein n=1 Tax=Panacibacter ginsenosidivorans TaxID=1813871 RepID=A0A5B8V352_9BACT|nr:YfhO family protein [Panacibacter ginsenosidivorans]QEC65947.1 YfhO family protein [Panacibacter ginsenosidivorans]
MKNISWKNILPHVMATIIFIVVAVIYCKPALEGKVMQQSDMIHWQGMAQSSFQYKETHGHFPLWINSMFGGMPGYQVAMDADNPISLGYLHHLFTLFLPAPFSYFFLLCISFYFLSQVLKVDYRLGILGAIGYAYASFTPIIVSVGHVTQVLTMGYLPFLLGAIFLVFQKKYWIGAALSSIFAALLIAQNHTQVIYYFLIVAVFAGIAYYIQWIKNKEYKHILITSAILISAAVIGVLTNLVSLATTYDYSKATLRGGSQIIDTATNKTKESSGLDINYAFGWSYGQAESFSLLVPNIYGGSSERSELGADSHLAKEAVSKGISEDQAEQFAQQFPTYWGNQPFTSGPVYLGAVICFLFIFGLIYLKGPDKWWIATVCLLAIVMAWGKNFEGFNTFLFNYLPFYNKFRVPTMTLVIPQFLFPVLAVIALQKVIFNENNKAFAEQKLKIAGYVMLGLFVIVGMLYMSFTYTGEGDARITGALNQMTQGNTDVANSFYNALKQDRQSLFGADILRSLLFAGIAFGILWLFIKSKLKPAYAIVALLLISSIDVIAEGRRYLNNDTFIDAGTVDENYFKPSQASEQILKDTGYYRVYNLTQQDPFSDALTSYFHNSIGGYHPAKLSIYEDLLNYQLRKAQPNLHVLDMLNTKYVIVPGQQNQPVAQQNPGALGPCWFAGVIDFEKDALSIMKRINDFNPKDTAILDDTLKKALPFMPVPDSTAEIKLIKNDNDVITYESTSVTNQFAVFSEIYYDRGWKAYIDNKESPIFQTDYVLRGLAIPAGNHAIRFEFKPASYYNSLKLSIAGSALGWIIILGAIVQFFRKKKITTA